MLRPVSPMFNPEMGWLCIAETNEGAVFGRRGSKLKYFLILPNLKQPKCKILFAIIGMLWLSTADLLLIAATPYRENHYICP